MEKIVPLKIGLVKPVPQNAAHLRIENSIEIVLLQFFSIQDSINLIQISEKKNETSQKKPYKESSAIHSRRSFGKDIHRCIYRSVTYAYVIFYQCQSLVGPLSFGRKGPIFMFISLSVSLSGLWAGDAIDMFHSVFIIESFAFLLMSVCWSFSQN